MRQNVHYMFKENIVHFLTAQIYIAFQKILKEFVILTLVSNYYIDQF